ncbi:MAG: diguanylate cyclase [Herminiimonas sp.]|nr:diguanylate cyclase [Herminiimonas sp.]
MEVVGIATRVTNVFADPCVVGGKGAHNIQASIGINVFPKDDTAVEILLKHADMVMSAAKDSGKAYFKFYEPQLSKLLLVRLSNEETLRQAIDGDQFVVHYQPRRRDNGAAAHFAKACLRRNRGVPGIPDRSCLDHEGDNAFRTINVRPHRV